MKKKQRGYTAVEMVAVAGTIGITAALATPSIMRANDSYRINSAASQVTQSLQNAKFEAIRRNTINSVGFDKSSNSILLISTTNNSSGATVTKTTVMPLPSGVVMADLPSDIPAPPIVQSAYNSKSTFKDDDYKNLTNPKNAISFAVDSSGSGNTYKATFNSKGLPSTKSGKMEDPGVVHWMYLKNNNSERMAITLTSAGSTQVWRYKDGNWITSTT